MRSSTRERGEIGRCVASVEMAASSLLMERTHSLYLLLLPSRASESAVPVPDGVGVPRGQIRLRIQ